MEDVLIENKVDEASLEREQQRSESEARDIIHDLDRLYTFPEEKKTRWVWELLQNAKDVAINECVNIHIKLNSDELIFMHNGLPFKTKNLLAILYKTSTKSLSGEGGTTGKYGTGFVTTHILNKKLTISGVHENILGQRRFTLEIDRSAATLDEQNALSTMQESLKNTFHDISKIANSSPEEIQDEWHSFKYPLKSESFVYAERGLSELERNLAFTLLINPRIKIVKIESNNFDQSFSAINKQTNIEGVEFISTGSEIGILYQKSGKLIFGMPAVNEGTTFKLLPIQNQAIIFKEFPLIGTEDFNIPVFVQHEDFHPTEQRDGIRTKVNSQEENDPTARKNREALIEFVNEYIPFIEKLIEANVKNTFLLAESGLPGLIQNYSNIDWYKTNIQKPIRDFINKKDVVETCQGSFIKIANAKFILKDFEKGEDFYNLASMLIPEQIPIKESIWQWSDIIDQDINEWPENIILNIEDLLKLVPARLNLENDESFEWLKNLYGFLETNNLAHLGDTYPIYPNESGKFCLRSELSIHPNIDNEFKVISKGLGRPLDEEFLNRRLGHVTTIRTFDLTDFYNHLNKELISELKIELANNEEIKAIFRICCLFRSERAFKRETWFKIINQLLPDYAIDKKYISVDYEYFWRSAELWSIKYICYLIEKSITPSNFAQNHFDGNGECAFKWLNDFILYIFELQEDSKDVILKRRIIPTQLDIFKPYDDSVYAEQNSKYFNETIKNIYREYTNLGDPRENIIDNRISFEGIKQREVDILTKDIDKLFNDENIESKVKKGGHLNEMFLQLNDWFEQFSDASTLLPIFSNKRASLYILALGEGFSKQIMEIQSSGKSIDDIKELAKIQLSTQEMKLLDTAASELGASQLLAKAQEMLVAKKQIDRWKTIGKAAETAFKEALLDSEPTFQILNPDIGKDFVIVANNKEYAIEIKSLDPHKGNVNMSLLQGKTAVNEKDSYSLCVIVRPEDDFPVDKDYFILESRFVPDIGTQIGNSIELWYEGLYNLETDDDVRVSLDDKTESIYISKNIWKSGIPFNEFISILRLYFA